MKKLMSITLLLSIAVAFMTGCKKDETSSISSNLSDKLSFDCRVTQDQPKYLQLLNPLTQKSWPSGVCYTSTFDFGPTIPTPLVYSNKDTMNITMKIHVGQVMMRTRFVDDLIDQYFYQYKQQPSPPIYPTVYFACNYGPGDYVINVNTTLSKRGLYNAAVLWPWSPYATTADTTRYNYDYHQFGIHDGKTNEYLYTGFILQSDKH
jgi:hypothetical protein